MPGEAKPQPKKRIRDGTAVILLVDAEQQTSGPVPECNTPHESYTAVRKTNTKALHTERGAAWARQGQKKKKRVSRGNKTLDVYIIMGLLIVVDHRNRSWRDPPISRGSLRRATAAAPSCLPEAANAQDIDGFLIVSKIDTSTTNE